MNFSNLVFIKGEEAGSLLPYIYLAHPGGLILLLY